MRITLDLTENEILLLNRLLEYAVTEMDSTLIPSGTHLCQKFSDAIGEGVE